MLGFWQTLRDRVRPLFYTRLRLGEFDPPAMNPYNALELSVVQSPEHRNLSLEAAIKSFVLLKNQRDTLPLRELHGKRLAVRPGLLLTGASLCWHGAVGACLHPSPLCRWWVPLQTTPVCCLGTTHRCRSHSTSTHHGEPPSVLGPGSVSGALCPSQPFPGVMGSCPHGALTQSCPTQEGAANTVSQHQLCCGLPGAAVPGLLKG